MHNFFISAINVFSKIRDEIIILFNTNTSSHLTYCKFANAQLHFYSERCQSANLMIQNEKLWDAEILMRAAVECATRIIFVSIAEEPERSARLYEYLVELAEINDISHSEKAKKFIEGKEGEDSIIMRGLVLNDAEENELRTKWPKNKRKVLIQKWSFTAMVGEISKFNKNGLNLHAYNNFLHGYGLSSHLIHADQTAIGLIWDRNHREQEEYIALTNAHMARLLTDSVGLLAMCWKSIAYALDTRDLNPEVMNSIVSLLNASDIFHSNFATTQTEFYEKYKPNDN